MIRQRIFATINVVILLFFIFSMAGHAQSEGESVGDESGDFKFQDGPGVGDLEDIAQISIPEGFIFAGKKGAQAVMEYLENPESGLETGIIAPADFGWFTLFEFDKIGYVKDDEKGDLDADAILKSIREGTEKANEERKKRGWSTLTIVGWFKEPFYNENTHNLEWATTGMDDQGNKSLNYNTRILGRRGVMSATLVCDPDSFDVVMGEFQNLIGTFSYNSGLRYSEYVKGDDIADIGLTALIVGGGAAVAAKSGLFKWLWKIIVLAAAAIAGFFRKLFRRNKTVQPDSA